MKRSLQFAAMALALLALSACEAEKVNVLKSPCASLDDGPCGPKRKPINNV